MEEKLTFEKAMQKLQMIVEKLENGSATLDESVKLFEEGTELSSFCYEALKKAEQKISNISSPEEK